MSESPLFLYKKDIALLNRLSTNDSVSRLLWLAPERLCAYEFMIKWRRITFVNDQLSQVCACGC